MEQNPPPTLTSDLPTGLYSEEEKAQILSQIDLAADAHRLTAEEEVFRPRKQGVLFPVLVNVVAVVLIVGAWFGADSYFQTRQKSLSLKTDQLFSAESKLLAQVLQDAKAKMEAAKAQIDQIQGDLQKAAADKANLQKSFESRVAAQDKALRQELADALSSERNRLQASGLNADEVARRLQEFESQKNSEFSAKLEGYRKQAQTEIDQQTKALAALQSKLQATVSDQEKLRQEVEKQSKDREGALQSQISRQSDDLDALRRERDELNLFFRQADAALTTVRAAFEARDWAKAQAAVVAFRQGLARAAASSSEAVRSRAQAQGTLADTLESAASALDNSASRAEAAAQLEALRQQSRKDAEASQQALSEALGRWREAETRAEGLRQDVDSLVARLDQSTSETFAARIDTQYLESRVTELEASLAELEPFRDRVAELTQQIAATQDKQSARQKALADVQAFTTYLRGRATNPTEAKASIEKLARTDADYQKVIDDIQALSETGSAETTVNTARTALYGTVAAVSKTKLVLEPLTKVLPEVGQTMEIRRIKGRKETVVGQGPVLTSTKQRLEVDWSGQTGVPLSGDAAYLVLP